MINAIEKFFATKFECCKDFVTLMNRAKKRKIVEQSYEPRRQTTTKRRLDVAGVPQEDSESSRHQEQINKNEGRELENPTYLDNGYDTDVEEVQSILNANSPCSTTDRSANDNVSSVTFIESSRVTLVIPSPLSPINIIPSPNSTSTSAENDPSRIWQAVNRTKKKEMFRNMYKGVKKKYKVGKSCKKSSKLKEQTYL